MKKLGYKRVWLVQDADTGEIVSINFTRGVARECAKKFFGKTRKQNPFNLEINRAKIILD